MLAVSACTDDIAPASDARACVEDRQTIGAATAARAGFSLVDLEASLGGDLMLDVSVGDVGDPSFDGIVEVTLGDPWTVSRIEDVVSTPADPSVSTDACAPSPRLEVDVTGQVLLPASWSSTAATVSATLVATDISPDDVSWTLQGPVVLSPALEAQAAAVLADWPGATLEGATLVLQQDVDAGQWSIDARALDGSASFAATILRGDYTLDVASVP